MVEIPHIEESGLAGHGKNILTKRYLRLATKEEMKEVPAAEKDIKKAFKAARKHLLDEFENKEKDKAERSVYAVHGAYSVCFYTLLVLKSSFQHLNQWIEKHKDFLEKTELGKVVSKKIAKFKTRERRYLKRERAIVLADMEVADGNIGVAGAMSMEYRFNEGVVGYFRNWTFKGRKLFFFDRQEEKLENEEVTKKNALLILKNLLDEVDIAHEVMMNSLKLLRYLLVEVQEDYEHLGQLEIGNLIPKSDAKLFRKDDKNTLQFAHKAMHKVTMEIKQEAAYLKG